MKSGLSGFDSHPSPFSIWCEMTQTEIREKYNKIKEKIKKYEGQIKIERAKIGVLQDQCEHPNMHKYSACGDIGYHCPDCGYDR